MDILIKHSILPQYPKSIMSLSTVHFLLDKFGTKWDFAMIRPWLGLGLVGLWTKDFWPGPDKYYGGRGQSIFCRLSTEV